jgi:hypothetical protein
MRIASFDVGIKNMAYCIFDLSGNAVSILGWNVVPLLNSEVREVHTCNCMNLPKTKKAEPKMCGKAAKFKRGERTFCKKHAENGEFLIPKKEGSLTHLKKQGLEELNNIVATNQIPIPVVPKVTKGKLVEMIHAFFLERCLIPITEVRVKTAKETDLIEIGKAMKTKFNAISELQEGITHVIIENQISPIANRMKTIQGMLAQYFIMKWENVQIEFISSANKLKSFTQSDPSPAKTQGEKYKKHKTDAIEICGRIIEKHSGFSTWRTGFQESRKKDDLADCFLQGLWYLKKYNIYLDS